MRTLRPLLVCLVALAVAAPAADAWNANVFSSPTGNIRCRYNPATEYVACITANDGWSEYLQRYERPVHDRYSTYIGHGHTLEYGEHWRSPGFNCDSEFTGMTCRTSLGHGFFISRADYKEW